MQSSEAARHSNLAAKEGLAMAIQNKYFLLFVVVGFAGVISAQDVASFAGKWKRVYAGKTYLLMTIGKETPPSISISSAVVQANDRGEITEVDGHVVHEEKMLESRIVTGRLLFKTRQDDGAVVEYEMTLDGKTGAFLAIVGLPANVKPLRLERSSQQPNN
jgi:hypothetical protein